MKSPGEDWRAAIFLSVFIAFLALVIAGGTYQAVVTDVFEAFLALVIVGGTYQAVATDNVTWFVPVIVALLVLIA